MVRPASAAHRYGERTLRKRVLVRCVCGSEKPVFASDLLSAKTRGCASSTCFSRWEAATALRERVDAMIDEFLSGP